MIKYKIIFTSSFKNMLKDELIKCKTFNSTYALKIEKIIYNSINLLRIFPFASQLFKIKGISQVYRKVIINKRFLIIFKIYNNTIYLLYFVDGKKPYSKYIQ